MLGTRSGQKLIALATESEDCHQSIIGVTRNPMAIRHFVAREVAIGSGEPQSVRMLVVRVRLAHHRHHGTQPDEEIG
jgi:hypothetical protein